MTIQHRQNELDQQIETARRNMAHAQRRQTEFAAWLLREVWGKRRTIRVEELDHLRSFVAPDLDLNALDICLHLTGVVRSPGDPYSLATAEHYRTAAQTLLDQLEKN